MCGIAGIATVRQLISDTTNRDYLIDDVCEPLEQMKHQLRHRGPEDEGTLRVNSAAGDLTVGFAHTRLSIIDLSAAGHQPMCAVAKTSDAHGEHSNAITYNGEIYNFQQLRRELDAEHTHDWKSGSDTEVLLRGYECWGVGMLSKLRGMFAFALWDARRQTLLLARDQNGIKPLYIYQKDDQFLFASEVRTLLQSGLVERKLNLAGLSSYLRFGSVQSPLTIVAGVEMLSPGCALTLRCANQKIEVERFRFASFDEASDVETACAIEEIASSKSRPQAVTKLRELLQESVRLHLVSDVPVAAFLSGGIDSSAIVALMQSIATRRTRTFAVTFSEQAFSEQRYAKLIADKFGTVHTEIHLTPDDLLAMLPRSLAAMDQPSMDGINTFVVAKAVRDAGVKVAMSGLGGDELFAGYPSFRRAQQYQKLSIVPSPLRRLAASYGQQFGGGNIKHRKAMAMVAGGGTPRGIYETSRELFSTTDIARLMNPSAHEVARETITDAVCFDDGDIINTVSRHELTGYMTNTLLRDTDAMSMAHALEVRVPFIDKTIVPFVLSLPGKWKIDSGRPKPLLLDAMGDLLPEEIWKRPKMGFTLPFEFWMRGALHGEVNGKLGSPDKFAHIGLSNHARRVWSQFEAQSKSEKWARSWALYVLAKWCEVNEVYA